VFPSDWENIITCEW